MSKFIQFTYTVVTTSTHTEIVEVDDSVGPDLYRDVALQRFAAISEDSFEQSSRELARFEFDPLKTVSNADKPYIRVRATCDKAIDGEAKVTFEDARPSGLQVEYYLVLENGAFEEMPYVGTVTGSDVSCVSTPLTIKDPVVSCTVIASTARMGGEDAAVKDALRALQAAGFDGLAQLAVEYQAHQLKYTPDAVQIKLTAVKSVDQVAVDRNYRDLEAWVFDTYQLDLTPETTNDDITEFTGKFVGEQAASRRL